MAQAQLNMQALTNEQGAQNQGELLDRAARLVAEVVSLKQSGDVSLHKPTKSNKRKATMQPNKNAKATCLNSLTTSNSTPLKNTVSTHSSETFHPPTQESNQSNSLVHTILFFDLFFDIWIAPALETHYASIAPFSTSNILSRMRIALCKNEILTQLNFRLASTSINAESTYNIFLDITAKQGIVFTDIPSANLV